MVAVISIRYELMSTCSPADLVEDSHNGIVRLNGWKGVEKHEVSFLNSNPCKKYKNVTFARAVVSRRVCELIRGQKGEIWISGGTATVQWNGKDLDESLEVQYNFQ